MGYLTTHVLDTARGVPAAGLRIELFRLGTSRDRLAEVVTNADGRTDGPILPETAFATGEYELVFHAGDYIGSRDFLDVVPIRFRMTQDDHYHVPLLLSPFGFSTYRGS
ncbi:MAG: hydroxyisourate hydrolase [Paracoccus sp. (in: a-proteobacteria)]|uniref:hydroxyisourate hydrolase n=1 Tax=Paracoccus sp. TaxID=267 RepID=UPI0026DEBFB2|nr:hydroxyisourate hydrolase [Paracoccus sp. (in: a-proteobacteria)]MDO5620239.1 hydroxyisourate hydrolase [Paracoccus sp. (in: a-proteobacteria)]